MLKVGYARVSSVGQKLEVQLAKLKDCSKIFQETSSGTGNKRVELKNCLDFLREGDSFVVTRLDRLARSTLHLCEIAKILEKKKVDLIVLDQNINTQDATGRLLFHMLGAIGQFETELRAERQMDGILLAKQKGVRLGRQPLLNANEIVSLKNKRKEGILIKDLMKQYNLSKASVYRYLNSIIKNE